ncbi:hypothetical protein [Rhodoferax sp.]|uniref:hypothetical protein n=1 Tax=Rhodoferax sp. TaxID=50421 RepID=UPI00262B7470|nr:hypothetical protein [Rhodoferax sp.]MDD2920377.1 hypothetical protein [Rhodoferax sp.]
MQLSDAALAETYRLTKGYPYFIQGWGYETGHAKLYRQRLTEFTLALIFSARVQAGSQLK